MRYKYFILYICFITVLINCGCLNTVTAQNNNTVLELIKKYEQSAVASDKVYNLYKLIDYYYAFNNESKADSLRDLQLMIAEESADRELQLTTLFPVYNNYINLSSSRERFRKELGFATQALEFAKNIGKKEYEALAYANIAAVYRNSGQPEQASKNADIAFSTAISSGNDSVKVIAAVEMGNVLVEKKDMVMAYRKFTNAYEIANNLRNSDLLSKVYYTF